MAVTLRIQRCGCGRELLQQQVPSGFLVVAQCAPCRREFEADLRYGMWSENVPPRYLAQVSADWKEAIKQAAIDSIRAEGGAIPDYVPLSASGHSPRSCPTCGPRPGGSLSAPLNETDKSCWRCGRTDLVSA